MKHYLFSILIISVLIIPTIVKTSIRFEEAEDRLTQIELRVTHLQTESIQKDKKLSDALESMKKDGAARVKTISNLQQQIASQEKKTIALAKDVKKKVVPKSGVDLSVIVKEWSPRVARIVCNFLGGSISGSGTASIIDDELYVFTNSHIISYDGYAPRDCTVEFLNGQIVPASGSQTRVRNDVDWGGIIVKTNEIKLPYLSTCSSQPLIGDQVVILGYPGIGSQNGITVTEGIISGIEKDYFVTSAKVEHGNSGGAAILVKDDCYLGPPSYGQTGTVESLSRILNVRVLY